MFLLYKAPKPDKDEPAFCHECEYVFEEDEEVAIDLEAGEMLCVPCSGIET